MFDGTLVGPRRGGVNSAWVPSIPKTDSRNPIRVLFGSGTKLGASRTVCYFFHVA